MITTKGGETSNGTQRNGQKQAQRKDEQKNRSLQRSKALGHERVKASHAFAFLISQQPLSIRDFLVMG